MNLTTETIAVEQPPVPPPESPFWRSLVMRNGKSKHWPKRFGKRIPMLIKMNETVRPDYAWILPPEKRGMILVIGKTYVATANTHGAVCGICECGNELGVKPGEFEVVAWYSEGGGGGLEAPKLGAEFGCGEGQALREGEREAPANGALQRSPEGS